MWKMQKQPFPVRLGDYWGITDLGRVTFAGRGGVSTLLHAMIPPTLQCYMEIRLFATLLLKLKDIPENVYCKLQVKNLYAHWSEKKKKNALVIKVLNSKHICIYFCF